MLEFAVFVFWSVQGQTYISMNIITCGKKYTLEPIKKSTYLLHKYTYTLLEEYTQVNR